MSPRDKNNSQQQDKSTTKGNNISLKNRIYLTAGIMIFTVIGASAVTVLIMEGGRLKDSKYSTNSPSPTVPESPISATPIISNSPLPITSSPTPATSSSVNLNGVWDLKAAYNKSVGSNGFINNSSSVAEYVAEINSVDGIITGKFLGAKSATTSNICGDAIINGKINGTEVNFTWQYTGSCCPNEIMIFKGKLNSQGVLEGVVKPAKIPTNNCNLAYGTMITTKRASDSP